jgi:hypothetical protein
MYVEGGCGFHLSHDPNAQALCRDPFTPKGLHPFVTHGTLLQYPHGSAFANDSTQLTPLMECRGLLCESLVYHRSKVAVN